MATVKVRHLVARPNADGTARYYWQPSNALRAEGWRVHPLGNDRDAAIAKAEELNADVDAWRRGETPIGAPSTVKAREKRLVPGSVAALIDDYRASRFWTKLAPRTRQSYDWCLDAIEAWAGDVPARDVTTRAVQAFYEAQLRRVEGKGKTRQVIETPAKAAAIIRVLRLLMQVGERMGYLKPGSNPAARPGISYRRQREPVPWSADQVRHMVAVADRLGWYSVGTAIMLNDWIGQREADVLALRPWAVEADALRLQPNKTRHSTGRRVALPVRLVPHLVARLKADRERPGAVVSTEFLLLHDRTGKQWNEHTFRHVFAEIRAAAVLGLPAEGDKPELPAMPSCAELIFMELRHTAVTTLHGAGVDALGISRITGHSPKTAQAIMDQHYLVESEDGAAEAFKKRLAKEAGDA